jgi:hypothetical protein
VFCSTGNPPNAEPDEAALRFEVAGKAGASTAALQTCCSRAFPQRRGCWGRNRFSSGHTNSFPRCVIVKAAGVVSSSRCTARPRGLPVNVVSSAISLLMSGWTEQQSADPALRPRCRANVRLSAAHRWSCVRNVSKTYVIGPTGVLLERKTESPS